MFRAPASATGAIDAGALGVNVGIDASCWIHPRGHGRYTRELTRALIAAGAEHRFWLFLDGPTARQCAELPGDGRVCVVEIPTSTAAVRAASAHRRSWRDLLTMRRVIGHHARRLDVLFFPSIITYVPVGGPASVVVTLHDTLTEDFPRLMFPHARNRVLWAAKTRLALRRSRLVFTVSEYARRRVAYRFGLRGDRLVVVPDAVAPDFNPTRARHAHAGSPSRSWVPDGDRYVLYVGGLSPHKNLAVLIEAFDLVVRTVPGLRLLLVGPLEEDSLPSGAGELRARIRARGLEDRVVFTGAVSDDELVRLYGGAQVLVVASLDEGFGLPAAEAMACGTPVLASRAGALPEVVGDAGRFFDPYRVDDLARELATMLGDPAGSQALGRRGIERARRYTWEASARRALAAFEEVAGAARTAGVSA
jgi:glycosyltransferase involved in cell wall biosynthesis